MGSQQLLLVVLSVVLVGVAITVAITMFHANAIESNRQSLTDDLLYYATRAREYYWRPVSLGGGGRTFVGVTLSMLSKMETNANGRYYIVTTSPNELVVMGVGKVADGPDTVQVQVVVNELNNTFQIIH
jgi:hypothetical protein